MTDTVLRDRYGLTTDQVADYYGYYSTADGYSDNLLAVEAKSGQIDSVKKTLEKYREDLMTAMEKAGLAMPMTVPRICRLSPGVITPFWWR